MIVLICIQHVSLGVSLGTVLFDTRRSLMDIFRKKEIVTAIYKEGGFSKAAKALHIAQPSLSVMVSNIEK